MGGYIELTAGPVPVDWSKNSRGSDHGCLFDESDRTRRPCDQADFDNEDDESPEKEALKERSFARPLSRVLSRLELLGHTLESARREYEILVAEHLELEANAKPEASRYMTFDEFCEFACRHPLSSLETTYFTDEVVESGTVDRDTLEQGRFVSERHEIDRIPKKKVPYHYWSEHSFVADKVCVLSPYAMLQVFGQSEANLNAEVIWQYGPLVESGWATIAEFRPGARRTQTVLLVTEGSTDARILKHALEELRPDIADFFRFVDVNESHPFWGTGNLVKFAEGLVRIDVHNQILFVLDNDAEGLDALRRIRALGLPRNIRAMILPDLPAFAHFPARGPEGVTDCDINGRAAAIECYLDLNMTGYPPAQVVWSNYKKEMGVWQGALEHKDSYTRHFLDQKLADSSYDSSKLAAVVDVITSEAKLLTGAMHSMQQAS